ncbi:hypothetical protein HY477_02305 [Candidatus Uhrbacteria bacterium]|nr:hypothetical protein [Candidatus Uhrbacteria bacterium]
MTERITSRQIGRVKQLLGESLEGLPLSKDVVQARVIGQGGVLKRRFAALVLALANAYFILLTDEEAEEWLRKSANKDKAQAKRHILGYRRGTREEEIPDSATCHIQVVQGATLKRTIPQIGPCVEDFRYLQNWNFPDPPTTDCLFSLVPTLLRGSTRKNVTEQRALLAEVRQRLELPENHMAGLGSVTHLAGAALTHKAAGRDIFAGRIARTETYDSDGDRLHLYWDGGRLDCDYWDFVEERRGLVGVLACGVEQALGS